MKKCYSCAHNLSCAQQDCPMGPTGALTFPKWEPSIAYLDGRRAGIEEALQSYRNHAGQSTDAEVRIFALLLGGHCGTIESVEPDGSAIVRTGK